MRAWNDLEGVELPEWARFVATDLGGFRYCYPERPVAGYRIWHRGGYPLKQIDTVNLGGIDWRETLVDLTRRVEPYPEPEEEPEHIQSLFREPDPDPEPKTVLTATRYEVRHDGFTTEVELCRSSEPPTVYVRQDVDTAVIDPPMWPLLRGAIDRLVQQLESGDDYD